MPHPSPISIEEMVPPMAEKLMQAEKKEAKALTLLIEDPELLTSKAPETPKAILS